MGLFSGKKDAQMMKLSDFFSQEDLQTIRKAIEPKLASNEYGALVQVMAKGFADYLQKPDKEFDSGKMSKIMEIANTLKEAEPGLAGILQNGIDKFRSIKQ